jgi:hypothetical protein
MLISEKIKLLFSEEMLTQADQLNRESVEGSFREKAVKLVLPLLPLAPGMNGAAGLGESDLDYLTAVWNLRSPSVSKMFHSGWTFGQTL